MKLNIKRRLSLADLGDGWQECYLDFYPVVFNESKKLSSMVIDKDDRDSVERAGDAAIDLLKDKFVSGKVLTEDGVVNISADDLQYMPVDVLTDAISMLSGSLEKKS